MTRLLVPLAALGLAVPAVPTAAAPPDDEQKPADAHHARAGNRVAHDALFRPPPGTAACGPARLWRVSGPGYARLVWDLSGPHARTVAPFTPNPDLIFPDYAALSKLDEPTLNQLLANAEAVVEYQSTPAERRGRPPQSARPVPEFIALVGAENPSKAAREAAVRRQFELVLFRGPTADELGRFLALLDKNVAAAGARVGGRATLAAVLVVCESLYHSELGAGPADAHGRVRLAPRELAFALAHTLSDSRPDAELLKAADGGKLETADQIAAQVRRLLAAPAVAPAKVKGAPAGVPAEKPRAVRFFREYFGYHRAPEVFKNAEDFKEHDADALVRDTDRLVEHVLAADRDVLRELLTTNLSFVGDAGGGKGKGRKQTFRSYGLSAAPAKQPVELPAAERAGVLTQPAWLVAHSENAGNHAILRGKWVRERLLGGVVPDLPITVNAQLPDDPKQTLRERMAVTRDEYCWKCHRGMDDLGLAFEGFDHFGRYRATELGKPADASGAVADSGDPKLDGPVAGAVALAKRLADSPRVRQVFVRHAFRYWLGRNETPADGPTLVAADEAYTKSGGSWKALVVSLLTSDSFLLRRRG